MAAYCCVFGRNDLPRYDRPVYAGPGILETGPTVVEKDPTDRGGDCDEQTKLDNPFASIPWGAHPFYGVIFTAKSHNLVNESAPLVKHFLDMGEQFRRIINAGGPPADTFSHLVH